MTPDPEWPEDEHRQVYTGAPGVSGTSFMFESHLRDMTARVAANSDADEPDDRIDAMRKSYREDFKLDPVEYESVVYHDGELSSDTDDDTGAESTPIRVPSLVYRQLTRADSLEHTNMFADARRSLAELGYETALRWVHTNSDTYFNARMDGRAIIPEPKTDPRTPCTDCGRSQSVAFAYHRDEDDAYGGDTEADVYTCVACGSIGEVRADGSTSGCLHE